jgi:hypothetical protein
MRLQDTKALIAEAINSADSHSFVAPYETLSGHNGGTYVTRELVYAYAIWTSPSFHLKVIRAYDTLQTEGVAVSESAAQDMLDNPLVYMEIRRQAYSRP